MQPQLNLEFGKNMTGKPSAAHPEPLFWVCEIRLLRQMKAGSENEIRRITFKKGMNIIWAEAPAADESNKQRFAGHASGKTTLCRLIRYALGETRFAADQVAQSIRQSSPDGGIVAHIKLDGKSWCVGRIFAGFRNDWSVQLDNLDTALSNKTAKKSYHEFRKAIETLQHQISSLQTLPSGEQLTIWHLFPWFTRDQDCQFTRLHEWRDNPVTQSDSPALTIEQAMLAMRSTIEPDLGREAIQLKEQDQLATKLKTNKADQNTYEALVAINRQRLHEIVGHKEAKADIGELFLDDMANTIQRQLDADGYLQGEKEQIGELENKYNNLLAEYQVLAEQYSGSLQAYKQHKRILNQREKAISSDTTELDDLDEIELAAQQHPTRKYCCVPLELAIEKGCRLATEHTKPLDLESKASLSKLQNAGTALENMRDEIKHHHLILVEDKKLIDKIAMQRDNAQKALLDFKANIDPPRKKRLFDGTTKLEVISQLKANEKKLHSLSDEHARILAEQTKCSEKLAESRKQSRRDLEKASDFFSEIVHFILGGEVRGGINLTAGKLEPFLEYKGPLTSAALNAVKNICLDLTALTLSIEGMGTHPRFLIHDGPRVSDLASSIFAYYFKYAEFLEQAAQGSPNFQYIITTTEPPPGEYQQAPWLVCKLDANQAATRLFKCDLA